MQVTSVTQPITNRLSAPVRAEARSDSAETFRPVPESARDTRPGQAEILLNSFIFRSRNVPKVDTLNGPVAALRLNEQGRFLTEAFRQSPLPIISRLDNSATQTENRINSIETLQSRLQDLQGQVALLRQDGSFNTRSTSSSLPDVVSAQAGDSSPLTTAEVTPTQLALGNSLASNVQEETALGLSGSFLINGFEVTVQATDSIFQIRDRINRGEDVNGNGVLDSAEDLNANGEIDIIEIENHRAGPGVFVIEDINSNGILEGAEDTNGNNRLDGGTIDTGVVAGVQGNRLILTSLNGGSTAIDLQDTDGVLLQLGFFELNSKNQPILRESQIDFDALVPTELNTPAQQAQVVIDGETFASDTNRFANVIDDTVIQIAGISTDAAQVEVFFEAEQAIQQIQSLFESFNASVQELNRLLTDNGNFAEDLEVQTLRNRLTVETQNRIRQAEERNQNIEALNPSKINPQATGLSILNTAKDSVNALTVDSAFKFLGRNLLFPVKSAGNQLFQRLSQVGIRTQEDDTVAVNANDLKQALQTNREEVLDILNNEETGILPLLEQQLESLLNPSSGRLDLKIDRIEAVANLPSNEGRAFRQAVENSVIQGTVRNLIAVV